MQKMRSLALPRWGGRARDLRCCLLVACTHCESPHVALKRVHLPCTVVHRRSLVTNLCPHLSEHDKAHLHVKLNSAASETSVCQQAYVSWQAPPASAWCACTHAPTRMHLLADSSTTQATASCMTGCNSCASARVRVEDRQPAAYGLHETSGAGLPMSVAQGARDVAAWSASTRSHPAYFYTRA